MYKKLMVMLQGAGINVQKQGNNLHLSALTDRDIDKLSAGEITKPSTVRWLSEYGREAFGEKSMQPIEGGLFDRAVTGGHGGNRFGHITLHEPLPQPAMEEPIRSLLGLTKDQFSKVLSGEEELPGGGTGGKGIKQALQRINLDQKIEELRNTIQTASKTRRDVAIKQLKYMEGLKSQGIDPSDMVVTKVPVIPPFFRPITATSKFDMVAGVNKLYLDLMRSNENMKQLSEQVQGAPVGKARALLYNSFKAVTGLGDPVRPEHVSQGVTGLLTDVFGEWGPKAGLFQRKLMGGAVDVAARAAITPNPTLDIDHIGIPEQSAWELYGPFVVRRLVKQMGSSESRTAALKAVSERTPQARNALIEEMQHRPVLATRAPVLHRFGIMAFWPVLTQEKTLQVSPAVVPGFNADFDGDALNFHAVVTDKGIADATERMLPSKNLRSPADFATLWAPRQEFLEGLYRATTANKKGMPRVFNEAKDVIAAYHRGELDPGDRVVVRDKK
jgi:DNA-directed RNA polymerase subunit beta'